MLGHSKDDKAILSMLTGLIGYATAVIATIQLFLRTSDSIEAVSIFSVNFVITIIVSVAVFSFLLSLILNLLINNHFFLICKIVAGVCSIGGTLLFAFTESLLLVPVLAVGIIAFVLLWASYFATLRHQFLIFHNALSIVFLGLSGMFTMILPDHILGITSTILFMISLLCTFLVGRNIDKKALVAHKKDLPTVEGVHAERLSMLGILGIMSSMALAITLTSTLDNSDGAVVISGAIAVAGFAILILRLRYQSLLERVTYHCAGIFATIALLPLPFVSPFWQIVCAGVLLFFPIICLIHFVELILEKNRGNLWVVLLTILRYGSFYLGVVAVLLIIFTQGFVQSSGWIIATCFTAVVIANVLQLVMDSNVDILYLQRKELRPAVNQESIDTQQDIKGGIIWKAKIDYISKEYSLSSRQNEIMSMLIKGRDSKYIMNRFHISRSTAKTHIANIYRKIDIHSRQELLDLVEQVYIPPAELLSLNMDD